MLKAVFVVSICLALVIPFLNAQAGVEDGKTLYASQKCQLCHSVGAPAGKKKALDGVGKRLGAAEIKSWIVNPKGMKADTKMKSYSALPAKDVDALVGYLSTLKD